MALADELAYMSAAELALRIRRRQLSPVEVVDAFLARIEARNPSINAFVYFGFEDARQRAKEAEQALMSGAALGPLHGVPAAIKDLFDFKPGWVSTFGGVRALKNNVVDFYCAFAERIEKAGAILVGKTNSPVMGFRGTCDNYLFGPSRNPFNPAKNSGGSSGGSAAAVADGMLPLAEGTDGGGSIRIPASWCGVYGYKQSFGRVPFVARPNAFAGAAPFLFEGPITRTVEDAALALTAVAGYDPRDPHSIDEQVDFTAATRRSIRGWKIAYSPNFDVFPMDRRVTDVVGGCRQGLRGGRCPRRGDQGRHRAAAEGAERSLVSPDHAAQRADVRDHEEGGPRSARKPPGRLSTGVPALARCRVPDVGAGFLQGSGDSLRDL